MIMPEDIERIDVEFGYNHAGETSDDWLERNDFSWEAMEAIVNDGIQSMFEKINGGTIPTQALGETIANSVVLGWELAKQLAPKREIEL